jgi:hypothetical protein
VTAVRLQAAAAFHTFKFATCLQVNINVSCSFERDMLKGDDAYELRLHLISQNTEQYPFKDDD